MANNKKKKDDKGTKSPTMSNPGFNARALKETAMDVASRPHEFAARGAKIMAREAGEAMMNASGLVGNTSKIRNRPEDVDRQVNQMTGNEKKKKNK